MPEPTEINGNPQDPAVTPETPQTPATPEYVSKADYDKLVGEMDTLKTAYGEAGKRLAVIDKVAGMLAGKPESDLSEVDQSVVGELKRLLPHVLPNAKALDAIPQLAQTVQAAAKSAAEALTQAAFGYQLELQAEAGLKVDNPKLNRFIGSAIKDWINEDRDRAARFWRGDRTVIQEGFKEVSETVGTTFRRAEKASILQTNAGRPANRTPGSSSQQANGEVQSVDFTDKKSFRAAFKAALG